MAYRRSAQFGGSGGDSFSDNLTEAVRLLRVTIRHGQYVDSIQSEWLMVDGSIMLGERHGRDGGSSDMFALSDGEYINAVFGRADNYIDQIGFVTNLGRTFGPYGRDGGRPFTISGIQLGGFFGRSARLLDAVGVFTQVSSPLVEAGSARHAGFMSGSEAATLRIGSGVERNHLVGAFQ